MGGLRFHKGWLFWFTGLPGSGKSRAAKGVARALEDFGFEVRLLSMDDRRKVYFPNPEYTPEEREAAYRRFADEGAELARGGEGVILDATAHLRHWRDRARASCEYFGEAYIRCELEEAMRREEGRPQGKVMAGLYRKALDRKRTGREYPGLGEVIGVDVPYEENPEAECMVDNTRLPKEQTLARAFACVRAFLVEWGALGEEFSGSGQ